ncbi:hypothetical protein D9757_014437 [Collybiopsis confluens]|uniref:Ubiquitin-like protease family profile domain-containing protein n=1 Tax=Collybiopsis confluens TaxID=2823264 RepID=A0A8H5FJY1_9AGAR|nr:hypothetical protein D9757_015322 [Collybiopsis confluens]KAF5361330.1 hypothetical protein D9757_013556 [Collybiopsis confluens]KAF5365824.1 hypothetical protein D9757_014437 [Collybiopsis confluens]
MGRLRESTASSEAQSESLPPLHSTPINLRNTTLCAATSNHYEFQEAYARAAHEMKSKYSKVSVDAILDILPRAGGFVMPAPQYDAFADVVKAAREPDMYDPFINAMQPYLAPEWRLVNTSNHSDTSRAAQFFSGAKIKPDLSLYSDLHPPIRKGSDASRAELFAEFKVDKQDDPFPVGDGADTELAKNTRGQIVLYINAIQCMQQRTRVFSFFILKDCCRLLCHSRAGLQYTDAFNYTKLPYLHEFLWRLSHADLARRGHDTTMVSLNDTHPDAARARQKLPKGKSCSQVYQVVVGKKTLFVNEPFTTQHLYPVGRATRCYSAYDPEQNHLVLLKDCWRNSQYEAEHAVYEKLHAAKVSSILRVLAAGDVAGEEGQDSLQRTDLKDDGYQLVHYRLVLNAMGKPITDSASTFTFVTAISDALKAHREACENAHILHRDISVGNIILCQGRGYLIDWERAKDINDKSPRTNSRTGTWQFLSRRLLSQQNHIHEIRDDLESFVFVVAYTAIRYAKNTLPPHKRLYLLQQFNQDENNATYSRESLVKFPFLMTTKPFNQLVDQLVLAADSLYAPETFMRTQVNSEFFEKLVLLKQLNYDNDPLALELFMNPLTWEQQVLCEISERQERLLTHGWIIEVLESALKAEGWDEKDWEEQPLAEPHSKNPAALKRFKKQAEIESEVSSYRDMYQKILSPSRPTEYHNKCYSVDCPPFGTSRSCTRLLLEHISDMIESSRAFLPSLTLGQLLNSAATDALIESDFPAVGPAFRIDRFYSDSTFQINQLREAAKTLSSVGPLRSKIILHLKHHRALSSDNIALVVLGNLKALHESIAKKRVMVECALWQELDGHPEQTVVKLKALPSFNPSRFDGKLKFVKHRDFCTLGAGRWLNDEVVNYFVDKWCTESGTTLGLNSFFAPQCLFDEVSGTPKSGILTVGDEVRVLRWCRKTVLKQGLKDWDSVFIPINETHNHWYSARIDFRQKRIDIYDSLRERCISNRKKPPLLRKNANLMLVLMWLTEVLSRLRGQEVNLKNDVGEGWIFDPHFAVHFQPNSYDCGVHLLWHLRHLLEFRQIKLADDCQPSHLRFTDDMVGKRLRMAEEMLLDAGLV